ncbi:MAG: bifunctional UDP-3-O-[3-hydroxymyristoyl] N-acetylglucosamine deacetylase/3-hydroxyacyl-ACP dehydratase [Candidatus Krumholzibacteriota bacterium]|nr:bifunctional UDP-3-O-[3-hydroxymyristoyl] N-acetylglucosamine deacetylase/3-hydroxyacyl-ACP dehydratase [Candidatus Krumholzibacteriota bacterium]
MIRNQKTIKKAFEYIGTGLHTGKSVKTRFLPSPPGSGIVFRRVDLDPVVEIPATAEYIDLREVKRNTTIVNGDAVIHTVEHFLAAVAGLQIDNLVVEIDAEEPPEPKDGSVASLVEKFLATGIEEQEEAVRYFKIDTPVAYQRDDAELIALPYDGLRISFTIEYDNVHIGTQFLSIDINPEIFAKEIAPARTFALMSDVDMLKAEGLIKGGSLANAVVVDENGIMNKEPLRFKDEFVRHKILDIIGDLTFAGAPVEGHIIAIRSGHNYNLEFARLLSDKRDQAERTIVKSGNHWDINRIMDIMPHRYPFLLIDRILELEDKKRVVGIKNVTINEPFFIGHFPGHPIMPAVLIIEAMAQTGGILLFSSVDDHEKYLVYFMSINNAKFRKPVVPGDQVRFELELKSLKKRFCKMRGLAYVDGKIVAEADLTSTLVER